MLPELSVLPEVVQDSDALARLARDLSAQSRIAVDTESNSLHAYRERVCLIQFSVPQRDIVVDPLALDDLTPLAPIFADDGVEKIFHASEYDIICLRRDYAFTFANIFDTMQAGRILGRKQAGLDRLLEEKFALQVNKRYQKADWGVRPLSPDLLRYAVLDTRYLIPLRDLLATELRDKQLWQLAQEDFRMACSPNGKVKSESPALMRLRARRDLTPADRAILNELFGCREDIAARLDRPPFKVITDDKMVEIARARPATLEELRNLGLGARQLEYWGGDLLAAVERGIAAPPLAATRSPSPSRAYLKRLERLKKWRKEAAAGLDVESDVVLPRGLLLALADAGSADISSIMAASPWRLAHFGDQITTVLQAPGPS